MSLYRDRVLSRTALPAFRPSVAAPLGVWCSCLTAKPKPHSGLPANSHSGRRAVTRRAGDVARRSVRRSERHIGPPIGSSYEARTEAWRRRPKVSVGLRSSPIFHPSQMPPNPRERPSVASETYAVGRGGHLLGRCAAHARTRACASTALRGADVTGVCPPPGRPAPPRKRSSGPR